MKRTPPDALALSVCPRVKCEKTRGGQALHWASECVHSEGWGRSTLRILPAFLLPAIASAQDTSRFDPVDHYGSRAISGLIIAGAALVLYSLIRYRGRTSGWASWGVLILGAAIIPIVVSSAGGVLVLERSQSVELCNSCHLAMKPYVDDMKDPKSQSMAAIHYANRYIPDNQCYVCHTSYGMFGTVQAKRQGLSDVYKYYTHAFTVPVKMQHSYPNNDCLKCHSGSAKFLASHKKDREAMLADEVSCMQCHEDDNPAHNVGASN